MKKIHVMHIIPTLEFGGAERMVVDLVNHADAERFRFTIITFSDRIPLASEIKNNEVEVKIVPKRGKISLHLFNDIYQCIKKIQPDVVHAHMFSADVWGRVAARLCRVPVVSTEHNINAYEGWVKNTIKRLMKNWSAVYVACSESIREYAVEAYHITHQIKVVRSGIEVEKFSTIPSLSKNMTKPWHFLILGRLVKQKGHRVALEALARLRDRKWCLSIVGAGSEKQELENMVRNFNFEDRVFFYPPTHDVTRLFSEHEVVLIPSLWEGLGVVAIEAMAAGRVVVASNVDGLKESIDQGKTGFLCESKNVNAFTERLEWCLSHQDEVFEVAQRARKEAKRFDVRVMVKKYEKVYREIVNQKISD